MFIEERQIAIEKVLREEGKVRTRELSEMFQVTEDCIRKDLKTLENAGKLKKELTVVRFFPRITRWKEMLSTEEIIMWTRRW